MHYIKENELVYIDRKIIERYSPAEIIGVKEKNALVAVIENPKKIIFDREIYPTIYDKGAILLIGIACKQLFHNGNKRTSLAATEVFFQRNGYASNWQNQEYIDFIMSVVEKNEDINISFDELKRFVVGNLTMNYK
ncbi:type II toxin-antitoxin system death-on-curing family toxin [Marinilactibacillus kalidii]|uniref:type II toxin-antitoxin system death-on-curing family toxin n=1 Tax=Marinilactibacillus kalidii TaxID=2820274 RepID=UPI001ABE7A54|nr:type II toxin-antitoxin system death-on-curing family toxin [Marinilactibacillus kalidii]